MAKITIDLDELLQRLENETDNEDEGETMKTTPNDQSRQAHYFDDERG